MKQELKSFLSNYVDLSEEELEEVSERFRSKAIGKNQFVFRQGDVCKDLMVVKKGCLRLYYLKDGVETSVWFAFQGSSAVELSSFISGKPSDYFLQAIEDSEVWRLPKAELDALYQSQPKMQEMMRNFWEDVILHLVERFTALQKDSAEKRYLDLLGKPDYLASIPQKHLASFIGVTPSSLSRIRRRLSKRD